MGASCCSDRSSALKDLPGLQSKAQSRAESIGPVEASLDEPSREGEELQRVKLPSEGLPSEGLPAEVTLLLDSAFESAGSYWWKSRSAVLQQHRVVRFEAEVELYVLGQPVEALYIVRTGMVERQGTEITEIGPLEELYLHESLQKEVFSHTATAWELSEVYVFPLTSFLYPPRVLSAAALVLANANLKSFIENREGLESVERCSFPEGQVLTGKRWVLLLAGGEVEVGGERFGKGTWVTVRQGGRECTVVEAVQGFRLSVAILEETFGKHAVQIMWHQEFFQVLQTDTALCQLSSEDLQQCYRASKFKALAAGKLLTSACKSRGARVFAVLQGECGGRSGEVWGSEGEICNLRLLSESSCFAFPEDLVALKDSVVASIPRRFVLKGLPSSVRSSLQAEAAAQELGHIPLFAGMPRKLLQEVSNSLIIREYNNGETVIAKDRHLQGFAVVLSGVVAVMEDGKHKQQLGRHKYIGESSVLPESVPSTILALGNVLCWEVSFFRMGVYAADVKEELVRRFRTKVFGLRSDQLLVTAEFPQPMTVKSLAAITSEEGSERKYGIVIYSLKKDKEAIHNEVSIMRDLSSPFLLYLHAYLETKTYGLIVFRFFRGDVLASVLKDRAEEVTEPLVRVYVACILLALQSIHVKGIVYLNLCPQNVYIDDEGLPRLIQYRGSQHLSAIHPPSISRHHYSAPEVLEEGRLSPLCDLWGVGVVMLECFRCAAKLDPIPFTPPAITDLLTKLQGTVTSTALSFLQLLLLEREGRELSVEKVMAHGWLGKVNWTELRQRKVTTLRLLKPAGLGEGLVRLPKPLVLSEYMRTVLKDRSELHQVS